MGRWKWKWKLLSHVQLSATPWTVDSPGQNSGVGNHSLLQGIFPTQGSNPGLLHFRWILYQLSHKGSPKILQWYVAYPFSSGSSRPRNWTSVSSLQVDSLPTELSGKPSWADTWELCLEPPTSSTQRCSVIRHSSHSLHLYIYLIKKKAEIYKELSCLIGINFTL